MTDQEKITHLAGLLGWTRNFAFQCWRYANGELAAFSTWNPLTLLADCEPLMDFLDAQCSLRRERDASWWVEWMRPPTDKRHKQDWTCFLEFTGALVDAEGFSRFPGCIDGQGPTRAAAFCEAVLDAFPMKEGE